MKSAIVTGPTGAVGVSLIKELKNNNWDVVAIVRPGSNRKHVLNDIKDIQVFECALGEYDCMKTIIKGEYDCFFHFAWDGTYGESRQDVLKQNKNVEYTLQAVEVAKTLGCKVFVGAGSQSEFGHVDGVLKPYMYCEPDNGYGAAKLAACNASRIRCEQLNIRHEWCRIVSLYGPYDGEYTMIMSLIDSLLKKERPICTAGNQIWDYIYSEDAAVAFRLVAEKGKHGSIYCLGSGKTRKLKEYMYILRDCIDPSLEIGIGEREYYPNQVMHLEADISNLQKDTGFEISTPFEEGIRKTIEWRKEELKETRYEKNQYNDSLL